MEEFDGVTLYLLSGRNHKLDLSQVVTLKPGINQIRVVTWPITRVTGYLKFKIKYQVMKFDYATTDASGIAVLEFKVTSPVVKNAELILYVPSLDKQNDIEYHLTCHVEQT